jgi:hypothetical protein
MQWIKENRQPGTGQSIDKISFIERGTTTHVQQV